MMKKTSLFLLAALSLGSMQAQEKKEYTNFNDTVFSLDEVEAVSNHRRPQITKFEVPLQHLPISINRVSAQSLELRGIRNIQDAVKFMPGVRIHTSYGAFQQLSVRGFDHSVMMIDGIRDERSAINNSYPVPDLSAVQSIELLKGPASVLYGHSAVGGVLNIVRKSPTSHPTLNARMSYGSFEKKEATFGVGGKLAGPVNYYANVNYSTQEGWRSNGDSRFSGYLALQAALSKKDVIDVRGGFTRDYYGTEIGLPALMKSDIYNADNDQLYLKKDDMLPGLDRKARYNNESDFMYNRGWNIQGQYTHTFSNAAKLTDRVSYSYDDIDYFGTESIDYLESDDPIYKHYYMSGNKKHYICLDTVYLSFPLRFSHIAKTVTNTLELSGKVNTGEVKHNYMGGYSFVALNRTSYSGYNLGTDVTGPGLYSHVSVYNPHSMGYMETKFSKATPQHNYSHALYLQDMMEFSDKLKALAALRYDYFTYMSTTAQTPTGKREYEERAAYNSINNQALTYRLGVVYLPHPSISLYASYANFFKPIRTFYQDNVVYVDANGQRFTPKRNEQVFKPEQGYQAEVGVKYQLHHLLTANASMFYIRKNNSTATLTSNYQAVVNGQPTQMRVIGQVGMQDSKGFDIDVTVRPVHNMSITLGYALNDSKIRKMKEVKDPELAEVIYGANPEESKDKLNSQEGNWQSMVPKETFYAYGSYTITKGFLRNLELHANTNYTGKVYRNTSNSSWYNPYWQTDCGLSYAMHGNVHLTFNLNNVFNNQFYNQSLGMQMVPNKPRNFQVALSYSL